MNTVIEGLRQILGTANFYNSATGFWDYGAMLEYFVGAVILCIVVSSIFRLLGKWVSRR